MTGDHATGRGRRSSKTDGPEGPYELDKNQRPDPAHDMRYSAETLGLLEFIANLRSESKRTLQFGLDQKETGIVLSLVRDHFRGQLTTMSSLALGSDMTYTTAYRAIARMIENGLILQRERTATGKSYSLHPSSELLVRWQQYALATRRMIRTDLGFQQAQPKGAKDRRKLNLAPATIPPLAALGRKLTLSRGLRGLVHADPTFMTMSAMKQHFEITLGVSISSKALSIDRLRSEIVANSMRRVSAYDFVACDLPWFGEMIRRARLLPLTSLMENVTEELGDFLPDAVASARRDGQVYGLPVLTTAELLFYRTDLFSSHELSNPTTIEKLLLAARQLHDPGKGLYGVVWNGGRGTPLGHTFLTTMASFGQPIVDLKRSPGGFEAEDASGMQLRPMFDHPVARAVATYLVELMEVSPPDILTTTWYDRARLYARGEAAMAYCHTLLAHLFELDGNSPARGRTGYLPPPSGLDAPPVSPLGGYAIAIPSNIAPERIPPLWEAIRVMTSASAAKLFVANGSLASPRFSVNTDPEIVGLSPVISVVDQMAKAGTLRMWPRPPVDGISGIITIAGEEMHDMLRGLISIDAALERAQQRALSHMRDRGNL